MIEIEEKQFTLHENYDKPSSTSINQSHHPVNAPRKQRSTSSKENDLAEVIDEPKILDQNCLESNNEILDNSVLSSKSKDHSENIEHCPLVSSVEPKPLVRTVSLSQKSRGDSIPLSNVSETSYLNSKTHENVEENVVYATISNKHAPKPLPKPRCNPPAKPKSLPPPPPPPPLKQSPLTNKNAAHDTGKTQNLPDIPARPKMPTSVKRSKSSPSPRVKMSTPNENCVPLKKNNSSLNESDISNHSSENLMTAKPSNSNKSVIRKESATKALDMLKKKGMQLKVKSKKVFKPHTSQSETDININNDEIDNSILSNNSKSLLQDKNCNLAISNSSSDVSLRNSSHYNSLEKRPRPPPPRPALPSILKNKHTPETPQSNLSPSTIDLPIDNTDKSTTNIIATERTVDQSVLYECISDVASTQSNDVKSSQNSDINRLNENSIMTDIGLSPQDTEIPLANENLEQKPKPKPARPPPIKLSSSHLDIISSKKLNSHTKQSNESEEAETSLLEMFQKKGNIEKHKKEVDDKIKDYISSEMYCIATQDYDAQNFTDISFRCGEQILVLKQLDDHTLFGRNEEGEEGPFPAQYVCLDSS